MSKIINTKTNEIILENADYSAYGIVTEYFETHDITYHIFESLSEIIQTMTGNAFTSFNTIKEMINCIPDIVNYGEETQILYIIDNIIAFVVLGWSHEENTDIWTKAIQLIDKDYTVI